MAALGIIIPESTYTPPDWLMGLDMRMPFFVPEYFISFDEHKKRWKDGSYKTTVIVTEGKVVAAPYSTYGHSDKSEVLLKVGDTIEKSVKIMDGRVYEY